MKKILITGASGMLGSNMAYRFKDKAVVSGTYFRHPVLLDGIDMHQCDNRDQSAMARLVEKLEPTTIIHCTANTNMDAQELAADAAYETNVESTANVLKAIAGSECRVVFISTDAVYPGERGPYSEKDEVRPLSVYGKTKLEAESMVAESGGLCLRTNLYGWNVQSKMGLAEWFLGNLLRHGTVNGFGDIWFSGMYTMALADVIEECLKVDVCGVFNCASRDGWTKYRFGVEIAARLGLGSDTVVEIDSGQAAFTATRGKDMRLDVSELESILARKLPTMADSLDLFMEDYRAGLKCQIVSK